MSDNGKLEIDINKSNLVLAVIKNKEGKLGFMIGEPKKTDLYFALGVVAHKVNQVLDQMDAIDRQTKKAKILTPGPDGNRFRKFFKK